MPSSSHPTAHVAAVASVAAGLIHAAAAGSHAELATLSMLFALTAVAQIGWAGAVLVRPSPPVVVTGIAVNLAALGAWVTARTVGFGAVEGLEGGQAAGFPDSLAAGLALLAVVAGVLTVTRVQVPQLGAAVPALIALVVLATVPAMAEPHDHSSHAHGDEVDPADDETAAAGTGTDTHAHDATHDDHHGTEQGGAAAPGPTSEELGYPASFAPFLEQAETPEARDRAERLIVETTEAMEAFPDEAALQAAGFVSIGDGRTGWEHYINVQRIIDPRVLDPEDIESIVLKVEPDGTKQVASAMYLLPFGTTMADAPDIAGELTTWHDHQDLCWEGATVVGRVDADGGCARGTFRATQPMLHVWMIEHECGPFAGIEGSHGSGCAEHDH